MGIFKNLFKRNLTPEEQEEKSRKEKEWADKCYKAGENFGERIGFNEKVDAVNKFGNKYPRTFFFIIFALVGGCLVFNIMFNSIGGMLSSGVEEVQSVEIGHDQVPAVIDQEVSKLANELKTLGTEVDVMVKKGNLTREDSILIHHKLLRIQDIQHILGVE